MNHKKELLWSLQGGHTPLNLPLASREWKNGRNSSYNCTPFLHSLLTKVSKPGFATKAPFSFGGPGVLHEHKGAFAISKGPCTQIVYTLAPKYRNREY